MENNTIGGALARGYTYPKNSHKVLDPDLIDAMEEEVLKAINALQDDPDTNTKLNNFRKEQGEI